MWREEGAREVERIGRGCARRRGCKPVTLLHVFAPAPSQGAAWPLSPANRLLFVFFAVCRQEAESKSGIKAAAGQYLESFYEVRFRTGTSC